jgi:xylan 1,4-beta-xylosidase
VTRQKDGMLVVALWNLVSPDKKGSSKTAEIKAAETKTFHLRFEHLAGKFRAYISRVDRDHGDMHPEYDKMGQPRYPTREQLEALRQAAQLPLPEVRDLDNGELTLEVPADGLAVVRLK